MRLVADEMNWLKEQSSIIVTTKLPFGERRSIIEDELKQAQAPIVKGMSVRNVAMRLKAGNTAPGTVLAWLHARVVAAAIVERGRVARRAATALAGTLAVASALLVAGCDKDGCAPASQAAVTPDQLADVRKAAENGVRVSASNPDSVRFRGAQVWPQAIKNQFAVCGQTNVYGPSSSTFVLFVAVVTRDEFGQDPGRKFNAEVRVGSTVTEATKVYIDTLARCFPGGGPQNQRRETMAPVPPLPDDMKAVLASTAAAVVPSAAAGVTSQQSQNTAIVQPVSAASPASGTVVMRQAGNIRTSPQGGTIRVEPAGKELRVFGEAPGGWLQIGDTEPNGWVHSSLVQRH